jgi:predicted DNA-binding protein (UPF0251 family)
MPRPRKRRFVADHPRADYFKPRGVPLNATEEVILPVEGLEALRLADVEGLEQQEAAQHMGVSRPTFSRILAHARGVVSRALVKGWALRIEGGDYQLADEPRRGGGRGRGMGRGMGRGSGRGGGRGGGQGGGFGVNRGSRPDPNRAAISDGQGPITSPEEEKPK